MWSPSVTAREIRARPIDIDKEIRTAGLQGFFCGLAGGMPGNLVMSFSVTAHKLGGCNPQSAADPFLSIVEITEGCAMQTGTTVVLMVLGTQCKGLWKAVNTEQF